jgi:GT2 family glycosyltransferase
LRKHWFHIHNLRASEVQVTCGLSYDSVVARSFRELQEELRQIERDFAQNGGAQNTALVLRLMTLLDEALESERRRYEAVERAIDDLDGRLIVYDNSRFFRLLRGPGRFLLDWKGRLGQFFLRSPLHPVYLRIARPHSAADEYQEWLKREIGATAPHEWFVEQARNFRNQPLISIVMPVYNPKREWLESALDSVTGQTYSCWELCLCDDGSPNSWTAGYLAERAAGDSRIHFVRQDRNSGISGASNRAAQLASGEYVAFMDQDDRLAPYALHYIVEAMQQDKPDLLYSDEDRLDEHERRVEPVFKPGWSPELLLSCMYMSHLLVVRRQAADEAGWFRSDFDGSQDYDLTLRITDRPVNVRHVPRVLYHWRKHAGSTAASTAAKPYAQEAGLRALGDTVSRRRYDADCEKGPLPNTYRLRRRVAGNVKVSLVICSCNAGLLERCIKGVRHRTAYPNYEIVVIEHGINTTALDVVKVPYQGPFNYAVMNNAGAAAAGGEILIFLNDDVEPLVSEWLEVLVAQVQRPEVGIAGAKLVYPSGAIQHAGIVIGIMDGVGHLYRDTFGVKYWNWLPFPRNVSAVTGACFAIRKALFDEHGGFDKEFPINYNDADLCLRVRERGYQVILDPAALLRHEECRTRTRGVRYWERERWRARWADLLERGDPFYSPNLTKSREDGSLAKNETEA